MRGVDLDPADAAAMAQRQDRPIIARLAAPAGFPAVAHIGRPAGCRQVLRAAEMLIVAGNRSAAILHGGEVDEGTGGEPAPVAMDLAMDPQPRDAAVGIDVEPDMAPDPPVG